MLAKCLHCVKLTVRDHLPLDMLNLAPVWVAIFKLLFAEKEWFLTGKSRAQTLVKTLPLAYGAGMSVYAPFIPKLWPFCLHGVPNMS